MRLVVICLFIVFVTHASAQTATPTILIDSATAKQHLTSSSGPFIPPIAKAAHVFGDVQLQLWIDTAGHVSGVTVLSGQPMLQGSALESAEDWVYQPFLKDGQPIAATTVITLSYKDSTPLPKHAGSALPSKFVDAQIACVEALQAKPNRDKQAKACGQAASIAETIPAGPYTSGAQRIAYMRAANTLLQDKQYKQALDYANKAVALVEQAGGDVDTAGKVYTVRAEVESVLNDFAASDRDFTIAESHESTAVQAIQNDTLKGQYTHFLKVILGLHANLLTAAGKPAEAQAKVQEAAKL